MRNCDFCECGTIRKTFKTVFSFVCILRMVKSFDALAFIRLALFYCLMLGLGVTIKWDAFTEKVKKPKGITIGLVSQFLFLPFCAWSIAKMIDLGSAISIALIIVSCCPVRFFRIPLTLEDGSVF